MRHSGADRHPGPEFRCAAETAAGGRHRPRAPGQGLHATDQPDYLLLNTLCGEISMFPGPESVGEHTGEDGPGLLAWVTERGLRLGEDGRTVGRSGRAIAPDDFLPRRVLGEYLQWFFERIRGRVPEGMTLRVHRAAAVDLESDPASGVRITLADGTVLGADYAFLTLGHVGTRREPAAREIADPYPLPERVAVVEPGQTVAVGGFGLSAMDVVAALTVGRGGRFTRDGSTVRYLPGGDEPRVLLYSRSGMPFRVRPERARLDNPFRPLALTRDAVASLRASGPLDFDAQLMPLLLSEMRIAHHRCRALVDDGPAAEERTARELAGAARDGTLAATLDRLDAAHGRFDPLALWDPSPGMDLRDSASYRRWLTAAVRDDLAEAAKGVTGSPVKAALEAVREVRDILRDAVNFRGLNGPSLDAFMGRTVPLMNRAVVGPQKERYAELLALADAGIVRFPFGPAPRVTAEDEGGVRRWSIASTRLAVPHREHADWLCAGNAPWPGLSSSASPLVRSLLGRGLLTPTCPAATTWAPPTWTRPSTPSEPTGRATGGSG
ncbi:FAD/NAD(P)-binding protein [Streptomyces sp. CA-181903]|uniref:FAD/NAD(P)-binding protein n=1 Tax=Streptomyces sp. CA-181903 TaxID=3240055 RepID=UPI003D937BC0